MCRPGYIGVACETNCARVLVLIITRILIANTWVSACLIVRIGENAHGVKSVDQLQNLGKPLLGDVRGTCDLNVSKVYDYKLPESAGKLTQNIIVG